MVGNIYESKRYRLFIAVPLILLLISLYFIPKIQLDQSLKGGVSVQLQTNVSNVDVRQLTTALDSAIPGAQASVSISPGGLSITMAANSSLASGEDYLLRDYAHYSNYTAAVLNITTYQEILTTDPSNSTVQAELAKAESSAQAQVAAMQGATSAQLTVLGPFLSNPVSYNSSSPNSMLNASKAAYSAASAAYQNQVLSKIKALVPFTSVSYNDVTPTLGAYFLGQMIGIIIAAFILVAIAVLIVFRTPVPSFSVVFGAGNDIIVALGVMGVFGIPLGVASIGGLLMLIGFSIDTDMLSAIRVLKRSEGTATERAWGALKTGTTMTTAAIISFTILFIASYLAFIPTYFEISGVVLAGLVADLATTWLGNMPIILWYKRKREVPQT